MRCSDAQELVHAYFDGELDLIRSLEVERHLRECVPCASELERHRALRASLRRQEVYHTIPATLLQRLAPPRPAATNGHALKIDVARPATAPPRRSNVRWWLSGLAAAVVASSSITWYASQSDFSRNLLADQIVNSHVHSLLADHLTDVESSDRHTVKPWFNGKLDFSPTVQDFASEGFPLVGGRLDYLTGRAVAAMVYRRNKHLINVFVWPGASQLDRSSFSRRGYNVIVWHDSAGMNWCAVSDVAMEDLKQLAWLIQQPH
jgi:anti-sigma factor RsiW